MAVESWITPEETPSLAEAATALIEHRLSRLSVTERIAFWASIRKAYNTPYNPPEPSKAYAATLVDLPVAAAMTGESVLAALAVTSPLEIQAA